MFWLAHFKHHPRRTRWMLLSLPRMPRPFVFERGTAPLALDHDESLSHVDYWRSSSTLLPVRRFSGRAKSVLGAMRTCETEHGKPLAWQKIERGHYAARAGTAVYTVRREP